MNRPVKAASDNLGGDEPSDVELMARVKAGDQNAFVTIVRRYQNLLLNFFRCMGVYTDAEDLAQETFVRLFKYRDRYEPRARFTTFLYLLARQVRVDMLRKTLRREAGMASYLKETENAEPKRDPPADRFDAVRRALDTLPETLRSVVVLSIYQELKYDEIAAILEIPVGTVKSRMFHALRKLREVIHEHGRSH